jgi:hypothetical protein
MEMASSSGTNVLITTFQKKHEFAKREREREIMNKCEKKAMLVVVVEIVAK